MSKGSGRRRALGVVLATLGSLTAAAGTLDARAEGPVPPLDTTTTSSAEQQTTSTTAPSTTTTATPPKQSTTTTSTTEARSPLPVDPSPSSSTTTSTSAPGSSGGGASAEPAPSASPSTGDGGAPSEAGPFPAELRVLVNSVRRTPANNTKALLAALAPLQQYGLTETQAAVVGFGRFPVAGLASYSHDWWFPRFGPAWRLHEGTDIFAAHGTPVRAPVDGVTKVTNGGLGGLAVYVVQPDGTYWYLAHLAAVAEGIANGTAVKTGQVVGFVGDSGNARGGPPHVHFEVHPGGGGPIDPKAVLDQFIGDATAIAPQVVEAYARAHQSGAEPADVVAPAPASAIAPALPIRAALLWTNAVSPTGGALHLAEAEAARVASRIEWADRAPSTGSSAFEHLMARRFARWWVQPLVHPALARHLRAR